MTKKHKLPLKPKINDDDFIKNRIDKLLLVLNKHETGCMFWKINDPDVHIMGLRPVKRITLEVINENGFNPYERKGNENLFKCFKILILTNKDEYIVTTEEIEKKNEIEKNGVIYIKHHDPIYIFDSIRNSK